jgi:putative transposase
VAVAHRKVRNQRMDLAHKLSRELVNAYDVIVFEDLKITSMVRRPRPRQGTDGTYERNGAAAKAGLNRSISDAGWGQLLRYRVQSGSRWSRIDRREPPPQLPALLVVRTRRWREPAHPGQLPMSGMWT